MGIVYENDDGMPAERHCVNCRIVGNMGENGDVDRIIQQMIDHLHGIPLGHRQFDARMVLMEPCEHGNGVIGTDGSNLQSAGQQSIVIAQKILRLILETEDALAYFEKRLAAVRQLHGSSLPVEQRHPV